MIQKRRYPFTLTDTIGEVVVTVSTLGAGGTIIVLLTGALTPTNLAYCTDCAVQKAVARPTFWVVVITKCTPEKWEINRKLETIFHEKIRLTLL